VKSQKAKVISVGKRVEIIKCYGYMDGQRKYNGYEAGRYEKEIMEKLTNITGV